ncbi:secreted protein [Serendipita vermifera]|nr:secreted protein [Serendipita vermifera]
MRWSIIATLLTSAFSVTTTLASPADTTTDTTTTTTNVTTDTTTTTTNITDTSTTTTNITTDNLSADRRRPWRPHKPNPWVHPGVFISRGQLDFIRSKIRRRQEPWSSAYTAMLNATIASLDRTPTPFVNVECGSSSVPNIGCTQERQDALAAYAMSLAWYVSNEEKYAKKAVDYFNAWSYTLKSHNNSNAPLQSGWSAASWSRAAEIIRHTYRGWNATSISQFETMFREVYIPILSPGSQSNGNWELVMMEALLGIGIFLEDSDVYNAAVTKFVGRVPAYIYLTSDGPIPRIAPNSTLNTDEKIIKYWQYQRTFVDGLSQETCRDFKHTGYGLASIGSVAESMRIQRDDLYTADPADNNDLQLAKRLSSAFELHTYFDLGATAPEWLCNGTLVLELGPGMEVGYNALHKRLHYNLPNTTQYIQGVRPEGTNYLFLGWETVTHAENPA